MKHLTDSSPSAQPHEGGCQSLTSKPAGAGGQGPPTACAQVCPAPEWVPPCGRGAGGGRRTREQSLRFSLSDCSVGATGDPTITGFAGLHFSLVKGLVKLSVTFHVVFQQKHHCPLMTVFPLGTFLPLPGTEVTL